MLVLIKLLLFFLGIVPNAVVYDPLPKDFASFDKDWISSNIHPIALNAICENLGDKPVAMLNADGHWVGCMRIFK